MSPWTALLVELQHRNKKLVVDMSDFSFKISVDDFTWDCTAMSFDEGVIVFLKNWMYRLGAIDKSAAVKAALGEK